MIGWTISQAKNSNLIDRCIVSTDSNEIYNISKSLGADIPFMRPEVIARDDTPMSEALVHALLKLEEKYDVIVLLEPTSPLRRYDDIDNGIKMLIDNWEDFDSIVSIGEIHLENPEIAKKIVKGTVVPYYEDSRKITRRQDLTPAYFPYGVIYASKVNTFFKTKSFYQNKTLPMKIERWQNYEIDDFYDLICVRAVLEEVSNLVEGE